MSCSEQPQQPESNHTLTPVSEPAGAAGERKLATFGSGCFWCTEAVFQELAGVRKVTSGFSGDSAESAKYEFVLTGRTRHAEVIQVEYDPKQVDYPTLLEVFWKTHDPTTPNRQGNDTGPQYRSVIFYHDNNQRQQAQQYKKKLDETGAFKKPIVTEISPYKAFYAADAHHQNYYNRHKNDGYCHAIIGPKLEKFRKVFGDKLKSAEKAEEAEKKKQRLKRSSAELEALKKRLTPLQYRVTQLADTEMSHNNEYWDNKKPGEYKCVVCGELLFDSDTKYDSHCGWPSFTAPASADALTEHDDYKLYQPRTEIRCSNCQAHLGHVFRGEPGVPGGVRYCMNSAAMQFEGDEKKPDGKKSSGDAESSDK